MNSKLKARIMNVAVWAYTIANAVLITGATLTFMAGNETWGYIFVGAEIIVNVLASINNPDFKGMITDKDYIVKDVEEAVKVAKTIHDSIDKIKDKN